MFTRGDEVLRYIADTGVQFVDVRFCDLPGTMQHFTVPAGAFEERVFTDGLMFDGSSIRGFQQIHESDMLLLPDPTTAVIDPFRTHRTLNLTFFVHDPLTGEPYSRDPRNIAKKAEQYLGAPASPTPRSSAPRPSSTSSTRHGSRPARTRGTTISTRSRGRGTPAGTSRAGTSPTSRGTRAGTSRSRRPTTTATCGPRWSPS
jgi:Glutamine synthetase, beta-Grasp domain